MPRQLSDTEFNELLRESDPFRLAIRGHAAIEADIDAAIMEAFTGETPRSVRELGGFKTRLSLAVALRLIPSGPITESVSSLAKLRNDFAHGTIEHLTAQRARSVIEPLRAYLPESFQGLDQASPITLLRATLRATRLSVGYTIEFARRQRQETERIVGVHQTLQQRLREMREPARDE